MNKQPNSHFCFICGVKNVAGVQVRFYETQSADGSPEILARFCGQSMHQGYPGRMHGGVLTGILDETMGRAMNYGAGEQVGAWGVTANLDVRFLLPVPLDEELIARGRITSENRRLFEGSGEVYLPDGRVAVSATGKFIKMRLDEISDADPTALGWQVYPDEERSAEVA